MDTSHDVELLDRLMLTRRTVRAFRPDPVPRELVHDVLSVARSAPSTFNTQPWVAHVLLGQAKLRLGSAVGHAHRSGSVPYRAAIPREASRAVSDRQADFFLRYYDTLGIDPSDAAARTTQTGRNFVFFDAPVGLVFTIQRRLSCHSWLDVGLFLQNFMLAAHARGLGTIAQVSFVRYESVIAEVLGLPPDQAVVCGMSLGWPEPAAPVNRMEMPRETVDSFTSWHES